MKKLSLFLTFFLVCLIGCSETEQTVQNDSNGIKINGVLKSGEIISPDGYLVAKKLSDLEEAIFFENPGAKIDSIEFIDIKNSKGAVAFIDFTEGGVSKRWGFAMGNVNVGHESGSVVINQGKETTLADDVVTYKCGGTGCCYIGGSRNLKTGEQTFYCKCENNPDGNSGCTLTQTTSQSNYIAPANPGGGGN